MGLNKTPLFLLLLVIGLISSACSSTNWVVVDEKTTDRNDQTLVSSELVLESGGAVTPNQPVVNFYLKSANTYEFAQRVKTERYVQRYKPRWGYVLLGMAGAGLATYAAYTDNLIRSPSQAQKYALLGAGGVLTGLSFLNMDPVGDPTKTGETRLLRKTGSITEVDTVNASPDPAISPFLEVIYNGQKLVERTEWSFTNNRISINLADEISTEIFSDQPGSEIQVNAYFGDLSESRRVEVSSVFEKFVVVSSQVTALRDEPELNSTNILTDLARGSQLKLVEEDSLWYKVLYGISETWVSKKDVNVIWRPSEFASDLSVIAVPNVPFGSVDVETNIPVLGSSSLHTSAFILANQLYQGDLSERLYARRDARLMEEYFLQAFGIRGSNITKAFNIASQQQLTRAYERLANNLSEQDSLLKVYISGYATVQDSMLFLIGSEHSAQDPRYLNLHSFFRALSNLPMKSMVIFADFDIISETEHSSVLGSLSNEITSKIPNSAIIFSSQPNQRSGVYSSANGEQKRHSIFTYYLADAFKNGNTTLSEIQTYLERNVTFTSRSLYDRPQNVAVYGKQDLKLTR